MSGEEMLNTNAEVVVPAPITSEAEASEASSNESPDSALSDFSLETLYAVSDEDLGSYMSNTPELSLDGESEQETPSEASVQAEPVEEGEEEESSADNVEEEELNLSALDIEVEGANNESLDGDIDFEAVYKDLFDSPIKAGGRDITIDSVDEAKRLIQQGVDYHKKMQEFSPYKKAMSLLKKRDALDPEKLNHLLDVAEGNPEALAKLLKDQEVNPYDIDIETGEQYKSSYQDTESIDRLEEIIHDLPVGESKGLALEILSTDGWDADSKRVFFTQPETVQVLHRQIENGTYDTVMDQVTKRKALGEFVGMPDIDAYNRVGQELASQGKLGVPNTPTERSTSSRPKAQDDAAQNEKRKKAAGAPRNAPSNAPANTDVFNPATATDEEVEKFLHNHLRSSAGT